MAGFKSCLLPSSVFMCIPFYKACRSIAKCLTGKNIAIKFSLCKLMLFIPINNIFNFNATASSKESDKHSPSWFFSWKNSFKCCTFTVKFGKGKLFLNIYFYLLILIVRKNIPSIIVTRVVGIYFKFIKITVNPLPILLFINKRSDWAVVIKHSFIKRSFYIIAIAVKPFAIKLSCTKRWWRKSRNIRNNPISANTVTSGSTFFIRYKSKRITGEIKCIKILCACADNAVNALFNITVIFHCIFINRVNMRTRKNIVKLIYKKLFIRWCNSLSIILAS